MVSFLALQKKKKKKTLSVCVCLSVCLPFVALIVSNNQQHCVPVMRSLQHCNSVGVTNVENRMIMIKQKVKHTATDRFFFIIKL